MPSFSRAPQKYPREAQKSSDSPNQNRLLACLGEEARQRIFPHLELVSLPLGTVLAEPGTLLGHGYFPTDCIISLLYVTEDGHSTETSVIGNEGLLGKPLVMGGETSPSRAVVQSAGNAYRLPATRLKAEFAEHGEFTFLMLRYIQTLITQISQSVVCNRHHTVEQALCRWLLLSLDRLPSNKIIMTQELIANMLGVRREGVTEAAGKLQNNGAIKYRRGRITVLDRAILEECGCECYRVVKTETDRVLLMPITPIAPTPGSSRQRL